MTQTSLKIIGLIMGIGILLFIEISLPKSLGTGDFRVYWSSTVLLARGEDFGDLSNMDEVQRTLTGWKESYTPVAWFAPTGNLVLLPYTFVSFKQATYYWLLTNIIIVFSSVFLIWCKVSYHLWIPFVATFSFSMTLITLSYGQVNTLVVLGLVLFLLFSQLNRDYAAGAGLVLTTIKAHLVIFTLPLLILDALWHKRWRVLAGFGGTLAICTLILFMLYPLWPISFWHLLVSGIGVYRTTPTLPGLLITVGSVGWGKWMWVVGLFLSVIIWWYKKKTINKRILIDVSILAGIVISPLGWSYDQVMLLFPILHVLKWVADGLLVKRDTIIITFILITANVITFYQRSLEVNEVWFFWVPLVVAVVYLFAWKRKQNSFGISTKMNALL